MSLSWPALLLRQSQGPSGGWIGSWSPGIGDPSFAGWLTVLAYLGAAYLCFRTFRRVARTTPGDKPSESGLLLRPFLLAVLGRWRELSRVPAPVRLSALWFAVAVVLFLLGINKQLDLQTAFTETGRIFAREGGWYENRRVVQFGFIIVVAIIGLWGLATVMLLSRGNVRDLRAVLAGTTFLMTFVAIRAASFHHVDALLGYRLAGVKMNWFFELGGIALIALGAYRNWVRAGRLLSSRPREPAGTRRAPGYRG